MMRNFPRLRRLALALCGLLVLAAAAWTLWNHRASAALEKLRGELDRRMARTILPWSSVDWAARVVTPAYAASRAASIIAVAVGKRRAGSFAIPRMTTASSSRLIVGTNTDGEGGGCSRCPAIFAEGSDAGCASRPVRHSNRTHAREYWSERPSTAPEDIRSGAM